LSCGGGVRVPVRVVYKIKLVEQKKNISVNAHEEELSKL
jgi:hypothetical protein